MIRAKNRSTYLVLRAGIEPTPRTDIGYRPVSQTSLNAEDNNSSLKKATNKIQEKNLNKKKIRPLLWLVN
jgi:hypothetical protein